MKICLAGEGAMGRNHMRVLLDIEGVEVASLAGGVVDDTRAFAEEFSIGHWSTDLQDCLTQPGIEAVLLATPSGLHCEQAELALALGKHVLVEIPMSLNLADARRLAERQAQSDRVCMVCHTRRFNPPHQEIFRRIRSGEFHLQHLVAQTYFFRRNNTNMFGKPRGWTDDLLWHHACHTVDLAHWLLQEDAFTVAAQHGPVDPHTGIPMDMSIQLRSPTGCLVSLVISLNNQGPFGTGFRYIGREATLLARNNTLSDAEGKKIPLEGTGFALQDREFFAAIAERRQPEASFSSVLPAMHTLDQLRIAMGDD